MDYLRLYWRRCLFWIKIVGHDGDLWLGPKVAWDVACIVYPIEDLNKWWLGTGWMGPGTNVYIERL
jgi:hypothetical protein